MGTVFGYIMLLPAGLLLLFLETDDGDGTLFAIRVTSERTRETVRMMDTFE